MTEPSYSVTQAGEPSSASDKSNVALVMMKGLPAPNAASAPGGFAATAAIDLDTRQRTHLANVDNGVSAHSLWNARVETHPFRSGGKTTIGASQDTNTWALRRALDDVGGVLDPETQEERYLPEFFVAMDPRGFAVVSPSPLRTQQDVTVLQFGEDGVSTTEASVTLDHSFPPKDPQQLVTPDLPDLREYLASAIPDDVQKASPLPDADLLEFYTQVMGPVGEKHARAVHKTTPGVRRRGATPPRSQKEIQRAEAPQESEHPGTALADSPPQSTTPSPAAPQSQQFTHSPAPPQRSPAESLADVYSEHLLAVQNPRDRRVTTPEHEQVYYTQAQNIATPNGYALPYMGAPQNGNPRVSLADAQQFFTTLGQKPAVRQNAAWSQYCQSQLTQIHTAAQRQAAPASPPRPVTSPQGSYAPPSPHPRPPHPQHPQALQGATPRVQR